MDKELALQVIRPGVEYRCLVEQYLRHCDAAARQVRHLLVQPLCKQPRSTASSVVYPDEDKCVQQFLGPANPRLARRAQRAVSGASEGGTLTTLSREGNGISMAVISAPTSNDHPANAVRKLVRILVRQFLVRPCIFT